VMGSPFLSVTTTSTKTRRELVRIVIAGIVAGVSCALANVSPTARLQMRENTNTSRSGLASSMDPPRMQRIREEIGIYKVSGHFAIHLRSFLTPFA
jgi:hypothetical protein